MKTMQTASAAPTGYNLQNRSNFQMFLVRFRKNWQLHLLAFLPIAWLILFDFGPAYGLQIAFREYKPRAGIWGSEWVGLWQIVKFLNAHNFGKLLWNTLVISVYESFIVFPIPIMLALILHINEHPVLKKVTQNISYMPHFISVVVLIGIINQILNPVSGAVGNIYRAFGGVGVAPDIRASATAFRHLYVWSGVWQNMGWNTILYVATLSNVSKELHEAAELDGASRFKRVLYVDLPVLIPIVSIRLILRAGGMLSVGFQKVYLMQNDLNLSTSEVISTYVYKTGLGKMQMSYGSAIGLFNSVVNTTVLVTVNTIVSKLTNGEQGFF